MILTSDDLFTSTRASIRIRFQHWNSPGPSPLHTLLATPPGTLCYVSGLLKCVPIGTDTQWSMIQVSITITLGLFDSSQTCDCAHRYAAESIIVVDHLLDIVMKASLLPVTTSMSHLHLSVCIGMSVIACSRSDVIEIPNASSWSMTISRNWHCASSDMSTMR